MMSMLAFDSRSLVYLLSDQFDDYFSSDFPIFYRQKIQKGKPISYSDPHLFKKNNKYFFRSAIDNALKNNQVQGIQLIINYIVSYQNNYSTSFLFLKNLPQIFEIDIEIRPLLESKVFNLEFDFDEWPTNHINPDTVMRPYNDSIFKIRHAYS